ncbi:MAG: hypothetical protein SFY66_16180 [Oculatellaceae cyanobacterium bins.114]|nr:hypothetical protein [Oculatellaceae cyanobacterium bins.114]
MSPVPPGFICYAHQDNESPDPNRHRRWLDRLLGYLEPLNQQGKLQIWSDQQLLRWGLDECDRSWGGCPCWGLFSATR